MILKKAASRTRLRFGVSNIKNMRQFYESWYVAVNRQPTADDLDWHEFFSLSFTHHMEILSKTKTLEEHVFYIHQAA